MIFQAFSIMWINVLDFLSKLFESQNPGNMEILREFLPHLFFEKSETWRCLSYNQLFLSKTFFQKIIVFNVLATDIEWS